MDRGCLGGKVSFLLLKTCKEEVGPSGDLLGTSSLGLRVSIPQFP